MTTRQIQDAIEEGNALKLISQAYGEIASIKLKKIRSEVERNRAFFDEIASVYRVVNLMAAQKAIAVPTPKKGTISVLITSNYRFYGNINNDLIRYFIVNTIKYQTDRLIIGETALDHFKTIKYFHSFENVILKKDLPSLTELASLATKFKDYSRVLVFYSQFKSVVVQKPTTSDITQFQPKIDPKQVQKNPSLSLNLSLMLGPALSSSFIFEPEIEKILEFFDHQVKILLLEQTFLESELARTASRLVSMDEAQTNANEYIKQQKKTLNNAQKSINNARILETIASLTNFKRLNSAKL